MLCSRYTYFIGPARLRPTGYDGQPSPLRSRLASRSCHSAWKTRVNALVAAKAGGGCSTARTSLSLQTWEKQGDFSEMQGAPGVCRLRTTQSQWLGWILPIAGAGRVLFLSREKQRIAQPLNMP